MDRKISLKEAERKVFRATTNDGLWDILLGCFFLMFPIGIYLSPYLGDFWASAAFLPFWAAVYIAILLVRKHVVKPRIGVVKFGAVRKSRLMKFSLLMIIFNSFTLLLGIVAALFFETLPGRIFPIILGLSLLVCFTLVAYLLDYNRLYLYGLLTGLSPVIGEWLWSRGLVSHHGFPITFGTTSGMMMLIGLVIFVRLLRDNPAPKEEAPSR